MSGNALRAKVTSLMLRSTLVKQISKQRMFRKLKCCLRLFLIHLQYWSSYAIMSSNNLMKEMSVVTLSVEEGMGSALLNYSN